MKNIFHSLRSRLIVCLLLIFVIFLIIPIPVFAQSAPPGAIPEFTISPEILAAIAGAILSLVFSYIPGLNTKYAALDETQKQLIMAGILLLAALGVYGLGCGGILVVGLTCDRNGLVQLIWIYLLAIMANQSVYKLTPKTRAVIAAKS